MDNLFNIVSKSNKIVFLGGAGTSTESGIPDFRGIHGMGHSLFHGKYTFEEILSHDFLNGIPKFFTNTIENSLSIPRQSQTLVTML